MVMKVLVGYASRSGAAQEIASTIADQLSTSGCVVRTCDLATQPALGDAQLVILGSGINATLWYPEASSWIAENAGQLNSLDVAVFNTCLNAADPEKLAEALGYNESVSAKVGARMSQTFAGRYEAKRVGFWQRLLLRVMKQQEQDLVDQSAARAWAKEISSVFVDR